MYLICFTVGYSCFSTNSDVADTKVRRSQLVSPFFIYDLVNFTINSRTTSTEREITQILVSQE